MEEVKIQRKSRLLSHFWAFLEYLSRRRNPKPLFSGDKTATKIKILFTYFYP